MVFTHGPSAHLPCLATRAGVGRITLSSYIARFVQGGVVKTFRWATQMPTETEVFDRIDSLIEPFDSYKQALGDLRDIPPGFAYCFAIHYVHADIFNGGISQLHGNSTWCLILDAIDGANAAKVTNVAQVLREIVYYYHSKGRSKLKRRISDGYFDGMPSDWDKSLATLEDDYFALESEIENLIPTLCEKHETLFQPTA